MTGDAARCRPATSRRSRAVPTARPTVPGRAAGATAVRDAAMSGWRRLPRRCRTRSESSCAGWSRTAATPWLTNTAAIGGRGPRTGNNACLRVQRRRSLRTRRRPAGRSAPATSACCSGVSSTSRPTMPRDYVEALESRSSTMSRGQQKSTYCYCDPPVAWSEPNPPPTRCPPAYAVPSAGYWAARCPRRTSS